jgi:predicted SAM-dependent methyltransferase
MKLEFGSGETPTKEGFLTVDVRDLPGVDYVCNAWEIDKHVDENSVDEIFSRHFFEHLTFEQGERQLQVWHKILKPGGRCEMMLPNMVHHVHQWIHLRNDPHALKRAQEGFWGRQRESLTETWDIHKSGYDEETLTALVKRFNYVDIKPLSKHTIKHKHLHLEFYKA